MEGALRIDVVEGTVLRLKGELDMSSVQVLSAALDEAVATGGAIVIDMAELDFLDSMSISVLIRTSVRLQDEACLIIHAPKGIVLRAIEAVGIDLQPNIHVEACRVAPHAYGDGPGTWSRFVATRARLTELSKMTARASLRSRKLIGLSKRNQSLDEGSGR